MTAPIACTAASLRHCTPLLLTHGLTRRRLVAPPAEAVAQEGRKRAKQMHTARARSLVCMHATHGMAMCHGPRPHARTRSPRPAARGLLAGQLGITGPPLPGRTPSLEFFGTRSPLAMHAHKHAACAPLRLPVQPHVPQHCARTLHLRAEPPSRRDLPLQRPEPTSRHHQLHADAAALRGGAQRGEGGGGRGVRNGTGRGEGRRGARVGEWQVGGWVALGGSMEGGLGCEPSLVQLCLLRPPAKHSTSGGGDVLQARNACKAHSSHAPPPSPPHHHHHHTHTAPGAEALHPHAASGRTPGAAPAPSTGASPPTRAQRLTAAPARIPDPPPPASPSTPTRAPVADSSFCAALGQPASATSWPAASPLRGTWLVPSSWPCKEGAGAGAGRGGDTGRRAVTVCSVVTC